MTVRDYLTIFRERWRILVICTVAGVLVGAALVVSTPQQYSSEITFVVSAQSADPSTAYDDSLLAQQKIATYLELLEEPRLGQEVAQRVGGDATSTSVTDAITATTPPETSLIRVDVTGAGPADAQRLATGVADVFPSLVSAVEAEANPAPGATTIVARVLAPPSFPDAPVAPGVTSTLLLALLLGLAAGLVAAISRHALDDSVRTPEALEGAAGAPALGRTGRDPSFAARPVVVGRDPSSPLAEAVADLRTHLVFALADTQHRVLVGTAPHAGAGTTSTLCNLAAALGRAGRRTVLVEADLRQPLVGTYLGLEDARGLAAVLAGDAELDACLQPWLDGRVDVLLAGPVPDDPTEVLASGRLEKVFEDLRHRYDLVLVDAPPALAGTDADLVAAPADATVLMARSGRTTRKALARTVAELAVTGTPIFGTVLTMVRLPGVRPVPKAAEAGESPEATESAEPTTEATEATTEATTDATTEHGAAGVPKPIVSLTRRPSPTPRESAT